MRTLLKIYLRIRRPAFLIVPALIVYAMLFLGPTRIMIPLAIIGILAIIILVIIFFLDGPRFFSKAPKPDYLDDPLRRQRFANRQCPACGYDLRAHLEKNISPNCPECGTPIPNQSATIKPDERSPQ